MTERLEMYRCEICGNLVQVILEGDGELVCCGQPMLLLKPKNTENEGLEKHIPVFEIKSDGKCEIRVGSTPHPMIPEHYIEFVETISGDKMHLYLEYLKPGMEPVIKVENNYKSAVEFCNIHGLWEGHNDK